MVAIISSGASTSSTPFPRDAFLAGANGGVKADIDLVSKYCWPKQVAPANGDVIKDLTEGAAASFVLPAGQAVGYAGGGFDFSTATAKGCYIYGNVAFAESLWGAGAGATATAALSGSTAVATVTAGGANYVNGQATAVFSGGGLADPVAVPCTVAGGAVTAIPNPTATFTSAPTITIVPSPQYFSIGVYVKIPALADFTSSSAGTKPVVQFSDTYVSNADICTISLTLNAGVPVVQVRRLTARNVYKQSNLAIPSTAHGKPALILVYRTSAGLRIAIINVDGTTVSASAETSGPSVDNFAACRARVGLGDGHWVLPDTLSKLRVYATQMESLSISGRDPLAIGQADFLRRLGTPAVFS